MLITGGGGFLGSHLVERVRGEGLELLFGFRAGTPFRAGLERTLIAWYRAHQLAEAATE